MKFLKYFALILLFLILFRGPIYRSFFHYQVIKTRESSSLKVNPLSGLQSSSVDKIIQESQNKTAEILQFTFTKCSANPNELTLTKHTNCIGYANLCASIINLNLKDNHIRDWQAKPVRAEIYFLNVNIHPYFHSSFFKDHDIVMMENKISGEKKAIDPTLFDYFNVYNISLK